MKHLITRILIDIAIFIGVFILPWWLWIVLCIAMTLFITPYYELVVVGFLADAAYGAGMGGSHTNFFFFGTTFVLVVLSIIVKPRLIFYTNR